MKRTIWGLAVVVSFIYVGWLIFYKTPIVPSMGIVQKIMYLKLPCIWNSFLAFTIAFVSSVVYLWKRVEIADIIALCSVEIGIIFCGITLVTGSIWAKPTWNTYWTWDARLTTTLILFLIFVGYLLLRKFTDYGDQQARLSAVIAIIGFLDIPLIHFSVVWWRTLHQPSTMLSSQKNVIDRPLLIALLISVLAFSFLFSFLLATRIDLEKKTRTYLKQIANLA